MLGLEYGANPSFIPDIVGAYVLELVVSDGEDYDYDNVAITAMVSRGSMEKAGEANNTGISADLIAIDIPELTRYVAMRIISAPGGDQMGNFHRFRVSGEGLDVRMND